MSAINPFSGYLVQGTEVNRLQAAEKEQRVRRSQILEKQVALEDDQLEHQVESAEKVTPVGDHSSRDDPRRQRRAGSGRTDEPDNEDRPTLDIKA